MWWCFCGNWNVGLGSKTIKRALPQFIILVPDWGKTHSVNSRKSEGKRYSDLCQVVCVRCALFVFCLLFLGSHRVSVWSALLHYHYRWRTAIMIKSVALVCEVSVVNIRSIICYLWNYIINNAHGNISGTFRRVLFYRTVLNH